MVTNLRLKCPQYASRRLSKGRCAQGTRESHRDTTIHGRLQMMQLVSSEIVMIGAFNPRIIEPEWLRRVGVVTGDSTECEISTQVRFPTLLTGQPHPLIFSLGGFEWMVGYERLIVRSQSDQSPGSALLSLLEALPHTPIDAVGNNFHFECAGASWHGFDIDLATQRIQSAIDGATKLTSLTLVRQLASDCQLKLDFEKHVVDEDFKVLLRSNFHRQVAGINEAKIAVDSFETDLSFIRHVVGALAAGELFR